MITKSSRGWNAELLPYPMCKAEGKFESISLEPFFEISYEPLVMRWSLLVVATRSKLMFCECFLKTFISNFDRYLEHSTDITRC